MTRSNFMNLQWRGWGNAPATPGASGVAQATHRARNFEICSRNSSIFAAVLALAMASLAHGHGTPIHVTAAGSQLVVSQGVSDNVGFASMMFFEGDEAGDPFAEVDLPGHGPSVLYQIPGFDIVGMENESSLSIEVLLRPVVDASPPEKRTLWYWNPQTELVKPAPVEALRLLARENRTTILSPNDLVAPPPLLLSNPMTGQQGFHNHGLLAYALDDDPPAAAGAYGFFARLTSNAYAPSEPFLLVLNRNTDYDKMLTAALAINAAALAPIPGDYDNNRVVEAADYQYWRERFGQSPPPLTSPDGNGNGVVDAADYVIWRDAFTSGAAAGLHSHALAIPEPSPLFLLLAATVTLACRRRPAAPRLPGRGHLCQQARA